MNKNLLLIAVIFSAIFASTAQAQTVATFEDLSLPVDSFWNGSDASGGFNNGKAHFFNSYNSQYGSWTGFAYSSKTDSLTPGYGNMYSSSNGKGYNNSATYAVGYISSYGGPTSLTLNAEAKGKVVAGFYINNNTYAYQSMLNGDAVAKKFTSKDADWFMLRTYGYLNGNVTDSVDFYLADFRFTDSTKAYILKSWEWLDLSSLGNVDSLNFKLSSSDIGQWGMNTPAYFCMDNFKTMDGVGFAELSSKSQISLYPNPVQNILNIALSNTVVEQVNIFDANGRLVRQIGNISNSMRIDVSSLNKGLYYLQIIGDQKLITKKFVKN